VPLEFITRNDIVYLGSVVVSTATIYPTTNPLGTLTSLSAKPITYENVAFVVFNGLLILSLADKNVALSSIIMPFTE